MMSTKIKFQLPSIKYLTLYIDTGTKESNDFRSSVEKNYKLTIFQQILFHYHSQIPNYNQ